MAVVVGRSMAVAAFDGGGDGLRIGNVKAKMVIDTNSAVGGDRGRQRLTAAMDEGGCSCLTVASVDNRYGIQ
jgi:hypothetical protein